MLFVYKYLNLSQMGMPMAQMVNHLGAIRENIVQSFGLAKVAINDLFSQHLFVMDLSRQVSGLQASAKARP